MAKTLDVKTWITAHYDQLLLSLSLVALLGSVLFLLLRVSDETKDLKTGEWGTHLQSGMAVVAPLDLSDVHGLMEKIGQPYQAVDSGKRLLGSEERVSCVNPGCLRPIPYKSNPCPFCEFMQPPIEIAKVKDDDGDGLTNQQELDLGLNPNDPSDAREDLDGDGFDNFTEIQNGTDFKDQISYPAPHHLLRLLRAKASPFRMKFESVSSLEEGKYDFQINMLTSTRTYFKGLGDEVEGYKIASYDPKAKAGPTLTLQKGEDRVNLVVGEITVDNVWRAQLFYMQEMERISVSTGSSFQILENSYNVIDIKPSKVIIRDKASGEEVTIQRISKDEIDQLKRQREVRAKDGDPHSRFRDE